MDMREGPRNYAKSVRDAAANINIIIAKDVEGLTEAQVEKIYKIVHKALGITNDSAFINGYKQGFTSAIEKAAKFAIENGCREVEKIHKIPWGGQIVPPPIKYKD